MSRLLVLMPALLLVLLAVAPAQASEERYRYIVGDGIPAWRTYLGCGAQVTHGGVTANLPGATLNVGGQQVGFQGGHTVILPPGDLKPSHGGACYVDVTPGETIGLRVVDDLAGPEAQFGFQVFFAGPAASPSGVGTPECGERVRGIGTTTLVVPEPCVNMHVIVDAVSAIGWVYVTRG